MSAADKLRKKKKYKCPNPLFVKWLTEWKQDAEEKGLKTKYVYSKALSSLKKYPLPLSSGKEAKILEYFGDKICAMLDAKLLEWRQSNCGGSSSSQSSAESGYSSLKTAIPLISRTQSKQTKQILKIPDTCIGVKTVYSGSTSSSQSSIESAHSSLQDSVPFICSNSSKITKLPLKTNEIEIGIKTVHFGRVTTTSKSSAMDFEVESSCDTFATDNNNSFYLFPGSFSIVLCVDNCETFSGQGRNKKVFLTEIQKTSIQYDVRKLHVGDFLWVARENAGRKRELVLDFIVERKRMDDLARSIKDGRFKEQKFRMKSSGLKSPIYLVEKGRESNYLGLPVSTCEQAIVNTQVIDGFIIKHTANAKDSVNYLTTMTDMIKDKYQNCTLMSAPKEALQQKKFPPNTFMTFAEFNSSSIKNKSLTVREMFAKHLLQFHGLSVDRAAAIVDKFETPAKFLEAYDSCETEAEKEKMVASIKFGKQKKNVGPALSRSLYQYYCTNASPK